MRDQFDTHRYIDQFFGHEVDILEIDKDNLSLVIKAKLSDGLIKLASDKGG